MIIHDRSHKRGVELGPYPLEALAHDATINTIEAKRSRGEPRINPDAGNTKLRKVLKNYINIYAEFTNKPENPNLGKSSQDPIRRATEVKGAAYYLDATHAGICKIPETSWYQSEHAAHDHAVVILVANARQPEKNNLARDWMLHSQGLIAQLRAMEIAIGVAGHIRALGFPARVHHADNTELDMSRLAVCSGITQRDNSHQNVVSPFVGSEYALAVISTSYAMGTDAPLAQNATVPAWRYWFGLRGALSGRELWRRSRRATHLSQYPMEWLHRQEKPTTLVLADEIPRVPKRAEFFTRARMGDLGPKAKTEVARFAYKHPLTHGMMPLLRALVPHQDGATNPTLTAGFGGTSFTEAADNTRAIKSMAYALGADLVGICEVPDFAWYSHLPDGTPVTPAHKYAVVMLIDQGYDTMEGASGDDWISGCQSMRGYLRGAEIAGVMAEFLRANGVPARPQTNADSHVLQIPLVLLAGLGELSRIGELVLNPFVGPRFKSVVLTTDLPLQTDRPIDFGLQQFCNNCLKCARECPVNAISFGDKVMFNGYEIWKPDVERCTRYRVTNPKGSACGRCMKTCPLNKVVHTDGALLHRLGTWLALRMPTTKRLLIPLAVWLDDKLGYGRRNPIKRWWSDLEMIDGQAQTPKATNERDLDLTADTSGKKSPVGYYHAADMPLADAKEPQLANHRAAVARADVVESPEQAVQRRDEGGNAPAHYALRRHPVAND